MKLFYAGDEMYEVEIFDRVDLRHEGSTFKGEIRKIHKRSAEVTVRYEDHRDVFRTSQKARVASARVPVSSVDLVGKDM